VANRLQHTPYFPVSPFRNGHPVPAIGALSPAFLYRPKLRHSIIEFDAFKQLIFFFLA
jgi:hypothetical protein